MSSFIRLRIFFYTVVIVMHVSNLFYIGWVTRQSQSKDYSVVIFKETQLQFFTIWTVILQVAYSLLGLVCDTLLLKNLSKNDYQLPEPVTEFREIVFAGLLWPSTFVVFTIFWSVYNFDRALIFSESMETLILPISNHVIHTAIVPVVLFEMIFRPRFEPVTHAKNVAQLFMHLSVYLSVLFFTYKEREMWLYPILTQLNGTIYFPLGLIFTGVLSFFFYYVQWPLTKMIHGSKEKKRTKIEKVDNTEKNK